MLTVFRIAMWLFSAVSTGSGIYAAWILLRRSVHGSAKSPAARLNGPKVPMEMSSGMLAYLVVFLGVIGCACAWAAVHGPLGSLGDPEPIQSPDFSHF